MNEMFNPQIASGEIEPHQGQEQSARAAERAQQARSRDMLLVACPVADLARGSSDSALPRMQSISHRCDGLNTPFIEPRNDSPSIILSSRFSLEYRQ
jgi:hypothetical protein